jgi:hypothetical protein
MTDEPGTELEPIIDATADTQMVIAGNTPAEILTNAATIASSLKDLIERQNLSVSMGRNRPPHVEVGGWQAAGAMLGTLGGQPIHAETVWSRRIDRDDVIAYEAHVEVKTLSGEVAGAAEAMCSSAESNWQDRDEYAIRSMAETRAESRAYRRAIGWIISLAGFSPTPAEEMGGPSTGGEGARTGALPAWATHVTDVAGTAQALTNLFQLAGVAEPAQATAAVGQKLFDECDGGIPLCVARAVNRIVDAIRESGIGIYHPPESAPMVAETTSEPDAPQDTTDTNNEQENTA